MKKQTVEKESISFKKAFFIVIGLHVVGFTLLFGASSLRGYLKKSEREAYRQQVAETYSVSENNWRKQPAASVKKVKTLPSTNAPVKPATVAKSAPPKQTIASTKRSTAPAKPTQVKTSTLVRSNPNGTSVSDVAKSVRSTFSSIVDSFDRRKEEELLKEQLTRNIENLMTEKRISMNRIKEAMRFQNAEEEQRAMALLNEINNDIISREIVSSRIVFQ